MRPELRRRTRLLPAILSGLLGVVAPVPAPAQESRVVTQRQTWIGYMSQIRVSDDFSLWNDAHFVPEAFYVLRTGLTYHLAPRLAATAGFAYLGLPVDSVTRDLKRREYRPWAQIVYNSRIAGSWGIQQRVRYDARLRRNVDADGLAPGYGLTNRVRFLLNVRRDLPELLFGDRFLPYVSAGNEVLLDWTERGIRLDQNRITAGLGVTRGPLGLQLGYMNRNVQLPTGAGYVMNHTAVVWIFHNMDLRPPPDFDPESPEPHPP